MKTNIFGYIQKYNINISVYTRIYYIILENKVYKTNYNIYKNKDKKLPNIYKKNRRLLIVDHYYNISLP